MVEHWTDECAWKREGVPQQSGGSSYAVPVRPNNRRKELIIPSVELSFELWEKSIKLKDWLKTTPTKRKTYTPKIARTYLKLIGLAPPVANGLSQDIVNGTNASESKWYLLILKRYTDLCIELKLFK